MNRNLLSVESDLTKKARQHNALKVEVDLTFGCMDSIIYIQFRHGMDGWLGSRKMHEFY